MSGRNDNADERPPMPLTDAHFVNGTPLRGPFPEHLEQALFGMGCFWRPEKLFWDTAGVYTTAVGYAGGHVKNPGYREVCGGDTGHTEVVLVVYDPGVVSYTDLLQSFWDNHPPSQALRPRNLAKSQYRSVIFAMDNDQLATARSSLADQEKRLGLAENQHITTVIETAPGFYYAEDRHQQYLAKAARGSRHVSTSG